MSSIQPASRAHMDEPGAAPRRNLILAWLSAWLVLVAIPIGRAASVAFLDARGYDVTTETEPPGLDLVSFLLLALIVLVPTAAAVWFGFRASSEGQRSGRTAATVAMVVGGGLVLLGLPLFLSRLLGWPLVLLGGAIIAALIVVIRRRGRDA